MADQLDVAQAKAWLSSQGVPDDQLNIQVWEFARDKGLELSEPVDIYQNVDMQSGGSIVDRMASEAAQSPEAYENYLRGKYADVARVGASQDQLIFKEGEADSPWKAVNPPGFDMGDLAEYTSILPTMLGGVAAGAIATPETFGAGTLPAMAAGETAGNQGYKLMLRQMLGIPDERSPAGVGLENLTEFGLNTAIPAGMGQGSTLAKRMLRSPEAAETYDAFMRNNIRPTTGMLGNDTLARMEGASAVLPFSQVNKMRDTTQQGISDFVRQRTAGVSDDLSPEGIGSMVFNAASDYGQRFIRGANDRYDRLGQFVPGDDQMSINNLSELINARSRSFAGDEDLAEIFTSPLMRNLRATINARAEGDATSTVSFNTLQALRTEIGEAIGRYDGHLVNNTDSGELRGLYRALTTDMQDNVTRYGEGAVDALRTADGFYRESMDVIDNVISPLLKKREKPEQIYQEILNRSKKGGNYVSRLTGEPAHMMTPYQHLAQDEAALLNPQQIRQIGAGIIDQASYSRAANQDMAETAFSPGQFQTFVRNIKPEARDILFGGLDEGTADDALRMSTGYSDAVNKTNWSGTAQTGLYGGGLLYGGLGLAEQNANNFVTIGGAILGANVIEKGLQSKAFQKWLTSGGNNPDWLRAASLATGATQSQAENIVWKMAETNPEMKKTLKASGYYNDEIPTLDEKPTAPQDETKKASGYLYAF